MPTAPGYFKSYNSDSKVVGVFTISDGNHYFTGSISPAINFASTHAELTYDNLEQLTSTRTYSGTVGKTKLSLTLSNGPTISGTLDNPINPAVTASGAGTWNGGEPYVVIC
jgi:hypothetical protein